MELADKMQRCQDYVEALEEERRKMLMFQRELPLSVELVTRAIEACKRELSGTTTEYMHGQSECSEQTSSDVPVLEEFIPIKRTRSSSEGDEDNNHEDEEEDEEQEPQSRKRVRSSSNQDKSSSDNKKKSDWLRSAQLWNQSPDPPTEEDVPRKVVVTEVKKNGGAFQPFQKEIKTNEKNNNCNSTIITTTTTNDKLTTARAASTVPSSDTSSTAETMTGGTGGGSNGRKEEKNGQSQRKQRRCWSPELHRRFLQALQQLGGSHAATPKQIRELMKVDGLTNDEVKSHLQKYRLHTRRPTPTIHNNNNNQAPQFVVVGGIWMPPPDYAAVAAATTSGETPIITAANGIYAPVATPPPSFTQISKSMAKKQQQSQSDQHLQSSDGHSEGGVHSHNSPSTSSSTHTTTTSPTH